MVYNDEIFGTFYEKGRVVCREGTPGDTLYVIQSGAVEISHLEEGREVVLALLEAGDFFGEMALVDDKPRSATATTIQPSRLLELNRESFLSRVRQDPQVALYLLNALSRRIEETSARLKDKIQGSEILRWTLETRRHMEDSTVAADQIRVSVDKDDGWIPRGERPFDITRFHAQESVAVGPHETVFREGDDGDALYLIEDGTVEIFQETQGKKSFMARFYRGDIFGEMAVFTGRPRTATALTKTSCRLLPFPRREFMDMIQKHPPFALYILQVLILRLRRLNGAMADPRTLAAMPQVRPLPPLKKASRARVALYSVSTCGGCPAGLLEDRHTLENLLDRIHVIYCPMLMDESEIKKADLSIVDGAVRLQEDVELIREVRHKSTFLVAWGTCAAFGGIPSLANPFEIEEVVEESYGTAQDPFDYYLSGSKTPVPPLLQNDSMLLLRRAGKLDDYVRVDYYLSGCPPGMHPLLHLIKSLRGEPQDVNPTPVVCVECTRKPQKGKVETLYVFPQSDWDPARCFASGASPCLGFLTKGGCGAVCPKSGCPCWGCRGPSEKVIKLMKSGDTLEEIIRNALKKRGGHDDDTLRTVIKILRGCGHSILNFSSNMILDASRLR